MQSFLHTTPQVLACIGEQFDEGDEVCGVTVNIRNGKDRLELWSKTAANEALQMSVGKQLKQMLDIPDSNKIGFVVFVSTLAWPLAPLCCIRAFQLLDHCCSDLCLMAVHAPVKHSCWCVIVRTPATLPCTADVLAVLC